MTDTDLKALIAASEAESPSRMLPFIEEDFANWPNCAHFITLACNSAAEMARELIELRKLCLEAGYHYMSGGIYPRQGIMAKRLVEASQLKRPHDE